jgi:hypothetical protein
MGREVTDQEKSYFDKAVKLVPTEIVGAYVVLLGMIGASSASAAVPADSLSRILIQVVFFVMLILVPLYLIFISKVTNKVQIIVTTIAFIIWGYTLGGPFAVWGIYEPKVAAVLLTVWSLVIPLVVRHD